MSESDRRPVATELGPDMRRALLVEWHGDELELRAVAIGEVGHDWLEEQLRWIADNFRFIVPDTAQRLQD